MNAINERQKGQKVHFIFENHLYFDTLFLMFWASVQYYLMCACVGKRYIVILSWILELMWVMNERNDQWTSNGQESLHGYCSTMAVFQGSGWLHITYPSELFFQGFVTRWWWALVFTSCKVHYYNTDNRIYHHGYDLL